MKVGVVGAGISGLVCAYELATAGVNVVIYEKEHFVKTLTVDGLHLHLPFTIFNRVTYPSMIEFYEFLGVDMEISDMSMSVSLDHGRGCEWGTRNGLSSLFAQKKNTLNPYFWQMIREVTRFKQDVISYLEALENNPDIDRNDTLGHFIKSHDYSELFQKAYLIPICASIGSCSLEGIMSFSAYSVLSLCRDHGLLQLFGLPQLLTLRWRSHTYNKVKEELEKRGCQIKTGCEVISISTDEEGCSVACANGHKEVYDGSIITARGPDTLRMLGKEATYDETRILGAFQYVCSDIFLHHDKTFMPRNTAAWSAWNFLGAINSRMCMTYWLNVIQNIGDSKLPYLVTIDPPRTPEHTLLKWTTSHPIPSIAASKASAELGQIQGKRGIWFCGAYQGYGLHTDGIKAGVVAADGMLRRNCSILNNPKHMVPTWPETGARHVVIRFFKSFIETGCIILLEDGGTIFTFEGKNKKCPLKVSLRIHSTQFYWKVATQADLGLADAFIHGDCSLVDKNEGLLNLFMIFIANKELKASVTRSSKKRGGWTPVLSTAALSSLKYTYRHVSNQNTVTQARRNISRHYDLSNELFSLFLDETMTYSCAIFKSEDEDLKVAQLRKINRLIEKAKISKEHHILDIGCGWGSLAVEAVKKTGCKYTGITLSEQQLEYAQSMVLQTGLQQDQITFLLCDYRQLSNKDKYDRIISCGMLEHVGHEYQEEFFACCESALAEDGLLVLQFIYMPDEMYDEYRHSAGFIKEYIFPGGCLPSLSRVTSAMAAASRLSVEHLEEIGIHYYQTLRIWRSNFLKNQSQIRALGFDDKFMRTWEYYFDYCASAFKTCTIGDYQIVFSRPGNVAVYGDPYNGSPSAY